MNQKVKTFLQIWSVWPYRRQWRTLPLLFEQVFSEQQLFRNYISLKWILWRISLTFETLWSLPKSRFFAKNRFNSKFQIKMFGVRAFSIKRAFLSNFSQKFSPKFRSVWPYRQSLTHPYPLISIKISHFYQTFRKNFHQNFGVCGLIGSNWRTQIEGCVAL